jgi:hypothetical protein
MSLLRLLTAGKTLIGLKRSESRYQLPGGKGLPMFGSKKNPFRATVFPDKAESAPGGLKIQWKSFRQSLRSIRTLRHRKRQRRRLMICLHTRTTNRTGHAPSQSAPRRSPKQKSS